MLYPLSYGGVLAGISSRLDEQFLSSSKHCLHHPPSTPSVTHPERRVGTGEGRAQLEAAERPPYADAARGGPARASI